MSVQFRKLLARLIGYRSLFLSAVFCNIMVALATVLSIPVIQPLLSILLGIEGGSSPGVYKELESEVGLLSWKEGLTRSFYGWFSVKDSQEQLLFACSFILIVFLTKNIFVYLAKVVQAKLRNSIGMDMRNEMMSKLLELPVTSTKGDRKGDLITRFTTDVKVIEDGFFGIVEVVFKSPLIILGSLGLMMMLSMKLTFFVLGLLVFTVLVIGGVSRVLRKRSTVAQNKFGELISILEESLGGLKTIKSFHAREHVSNFFEKQNASYVHALMRIIYRSDLASPLSEFLGILVVIMLLWFGTGLIFSGEMTAPTFLTFIFAFYNIIDPSKTFSTAAYKIQESLGAYDRVEDFLERQSEHAIYRYGDRELTEFGQGIEFRDVRFRYDDGDHDVLSELNLSIPKGSTVAFVGHSGSGKSTLVDLVCRFVSPSGGVITLDGIPLRDLSETSVRRLITLVPQDSILFNDTVRQNIVFGHAPVDDDAIYRALDLANARDFVKDMPKELEASIGDGGSRLSGGQRQRLSIARALLRDSPIMIFDEATSALDGESEKKIQDAIERISRDKTTIMVAHRLTTVMQADCIFVLDKGRIVERGTHEELIARSGSYARFVDLQQLPT